MIHEKTVYSMTCDGCGKTYYALGFSEFDDDDELLCAVERGWVGEVDGEPFGESMYHFCGEKCREEWKQRNN